MQDLPTDVILQRGWLSWQPEEFQRAILSAGSLRQYERDAVVYLQGDAPGGIFGIVSGSLSVSVAPGESGPHLAHLATCGTWFGEGGFLTGEPRRVGLLAMQESVLFHLPLEAMERLASEDPVNIRRFGQIAVCSLDLALRVVGDLLIAETDRRIAAVLLRLRDGKGERTIPLSQGELGHLANASRKVVNRTLSEFQRRGWIRSGYASIELVEPGRLLDLVAGG